ncbi:hypothetical protein D3C86_2139890 [compost metagenome]
MTWLKIEYFPQSAVKAAPASKDIAPFEPTGEHDFVRCWDIEELAVHFLPLQFEKWPDPLRNGMSWRGDPEPFLLPYIAIQ